MNDFPGWRESSLGGILVGVIDYRGRTPLKIGMKWCAEGEILSLSANNVKQGYVDYVKDAHYGDNDLYTAWMTRGDCKKGDIVITMEAPLGNVAQIPDDAKYILSQRVILLKIDKDQAVDDFIAYLLRGDAFQSDLLKNSTGSTVSGIQYKKLKNIFLRIPPKGQQQKIAKILTTVDNLIEKTQSLIDKYTAIKQGMMTDLFTRGIDLSGTPDTNPNYGQLRPPVEQASELYKETELGWVPKEWEVSTLKSRLHGHGFVQTGPFGSQLHSYDYVESGIPVVMPQDIDDGVISRDKIAYISEEKSATLSRHLMMDNDVVFSRRGDLTRCAYISFERDNVGYFCGTGCLLLRVDPQCIHGGWLSLLYGHRIVQAQVDGLAVGTTMPNLNSSILGKLCLAFPNLNEQKHIYDRVLSVSGNIAIANLEVHKLKKLKQGLMHDLLTGKVEVS